MKGFKKVPKYQDWDCMKILESTQYHNWAKYVQKLIPITNQSGFQHVEQYIPGHENLHVLVA